MTEQNDSITYNEIEIDPLNDLFDKIHKARGGEMLLVHVSEYGKKGPSIRIFSIMQKQGSILADFLPKMVDKLTNE